MSQTITSSLTGTGAAEVWEELSRLADEARGGAMLLRRGLAGALNDRIRRLPSEVGADESAPLLNRLLSEGRLEGLEDETGQLSTHVATRTLIGLDYPHALEVTPEHLEELNRSKLRPTRLPVPTKPIGLVLLATLLAQVGLVASGVDSRSSGSSVVMLADILGSWVLGSPHIVAQDCLGQAPEFAFPRYVGYVVWNLLAYFLATGLGRFSSLRPLVVSFFGMVSLSGLLVTVGELGNGPGTGTGVSGLVATVSATIVTWLLWRKGSGLAEPSVQSRE